MYTRHYYAISVERDLHMELQKAKHGVYHSVTQNQMLRDLIRRGLAVSECGNLEQEKTKSL